MAKAAEPKEIQEAVPYDPMKDMIPVTLPRATGNEQNFELVSLNGKVWKIQKGVTVRVPRPVYAILAESQRNEERLRAFNAAQAEKASR